MKYKIKALTNREYKSYSKLPDFLKEQLEIIDFLNEYETCPLDQFRKDLLKISSTWMTKEDFLKFLDSHKPNVLQNEYYELLDNIKYAEENYFYIKPIF